MATISTPLATAQATEKLATRALGTDLSGDVRFAKCTYTTTATTAAGDVLRLCQLPKGAVVIPGASFIDTEDCGTGVSVKIGDADTIADDDRYSEAVSLSTKGRVAFANGVAGPNPHALASQAWVQAVVVDAGSISVDADKDFTVWVAYRLP